MKKLTKKSASYTFHVWVLPNSIFSKEKVSQSANKINIFICLFGICVREKGVFLPFRIVLISKKLLIALKYNHYFVVNGILIKM